MVYNESKYNKNWKTMKLSDLGEFARGKSTHRPRNDKNLFEGGGYPLVQTGEIKEANLYITHHTQEYGEFGLQQSKLWDAETLCITIAANIAETALLAYPMCFPDSVVGFKAYKEVSSEKFMYYVFDFIRNSIQNAASGSTQDNINIDYLTSLDFKVPDKIAQDKMVELLSAIDEKILMNSKINDNLEQQAQAIYHERFETASPDDLHSGWRTVTLGEVATILNKSFNPLKEPEMLLEHYSIPAFDEARFPVFDLSTSIKSNKFIIDASCFMISKLNPTTKRVWKPYCLTGNAVCSTEFIVYKAKDKTITDFLYSVIDSNSFSDFMCSHVTGSTGSRQRTTPSDTLSYKLILPSEDDLAEFQSLVSPMYAQIRINAIENDRLKRLRDSLLPKLMSGEIDVSAVQF